MSHGFSRFGPPPARERLHRQMRGPGTISILLPTIVATLFMFTVVITLNKASSLTRGGKVVRLMNVDDVFPTPESVEQNRKKEFWELTVPPPSPDAVLGVQEQLELPTLSESRTLKWPGSGGGYRTLPELPKFDPSTMKPKLEVAPGSRSRSTPTRQHTISTTEIQLPTVAPDTSLPVATPTP